MPIPALENFGTFAETTTTADPGAAGTSLSVAAAGAAAPFPTVAGQFHIVVQASKYDDTGREILLVTAGQGTQTWTVTRGVDNTTGVAHATGSYVAVVPTAEVLRRHISEYLYQARMNQLIAWSFDPVCCGGGQAPAAGVLYVARVNLPEPILITNAWCYVQQAGSGATALANCAIAVYNSSGTRIGLSASQVTPWQSNGFKAAALTLDAGQTLTQGGPGGYVYVGVVVGTQSTTLLQFFRAAGGIQSLGDAGNTVNTNVPRFAQSGSALTAPPTSFTPLSGQTLSYSWCFGVS